MKFSRRAGLFASVIVLSLGLSLVLVSPLGLKWLAKIQGFNWVRIADVSQSYGAAGVLLTALAFGGVLGALLVQIKDARINQENYARNFHLDLMRLALDDETLRASFPNLTMGKSADERSLMYANLWMTYWRTVYAIRYITEQELRMQLENYFSGEAGRKMWDSSRAYYRAGAGNRQMRKFNDVVEDEYLKALARPATLLANRVVVSEKSDRESRKLHLMAAGTGIVLGFAVIRHRFSRH